MMSILLSLLLLAGRVHAQTLSQARPKTWSSPASVKTRFINLGWSHWSAGRGEKFRALTGQLGYRATPWLGGQFEATQGASDAGHRQEIYSLSLQLTPFGAPAGPPPLVTLEFLAGGSYFVHGRDGAAFAAGSVNVELAPHLAIAGQYRKYIGMADVVGPAYDHRAAPEDFTTVVASVLF